MVPVGGHGYWVDLRQLGVFAASDPKSVSRLAVLEDGKPLPQPRRLHTAIRAQGMGRFSHWEDGLLFSTTDNSDPHTNGRTYLLDVPQTLADRLKRLGWKARRQAATLARTVLRRKRPAA